MDTELKSYFIDVWTFFLVLIDDVTQYRISWMNFEVDRKTHKQQLKAISIKTWQSI